MQDLPFDLPVLNGQGLKRSFVLRRLRRQIGFMLEGVGSDNLRWLITRNQHIKDFIQSEAQVIVARKAREYAWVRDIISEDDLLEVLPDEVRGVIDRYGEDGQRWLKEEVHWFWSLFGGEK